MVYVVLSDLVLNDIVIFLLVLCFYGLFVFFVCLYFKARHKIKLLEIEVSKSRENKDIKTEKSNQLEDDSEVVRLLTNILNIGLVDSPLSELTMRMVHLLRDYYKIKYVTFFIKSENGWLSTLSTNVPNYRVFQTERYYNEQLSKMRTDTRVEILECFDDNNFLCKNNLEYSNFTLIRQNGSVVGALLLEHDNKDEIESNNKQFKLYDKIFNATSLVLKHVIEIGEMIKRVSTDQLTGVYNRRFIDLTLYEGVEKHRNLGQSFHIALLDIDFFKKFNDTYGHQFGDKVLQEVSGYIKENLGVHSWVARYGGEEFLIFIANSDIKRVYTKVDAIRQGISELDLEYEGENAKVTASFGIAGYPKMGLTQEDLIGNADKALYESKATGRNKVTIFNSGS